MKTNEEQKFEQTYGAPRQREEPSASSKKRKVLLPKFRVSELLAGVVSALFLVGGFILGGFLLLLGLAAAVVFLIWFGLSWFLSPRRPSGGKNVLIVRKFDP